MRFVSVEASATRLFAQTVEDGEDGVDVAVLQRPYQDRRAVSRFENARVHRRLIRAAANRIAIGVCDSNG